MQVLEKCRTLINVFSNSHLLGDELAAAQRATGTTRGLVKPVPTRFVTEYLMGRSVYNNEAALKVSELMSAAAFFVASWLLCCTDSVGLIWVALMWVAGRCLQVDTGAQRLQPSAHRGAGHHQRPSFLGGALCRAG